MYKKFLLSCTAAVAVMLLNTHFNAYAEILSAKSGEEKTAPSGSSYDAIEVTSGGKINGENLNVISSDPQKIHTGASSKGAGSEINLMGTTTIKNFKNGLEVSNEATIKMTDGSIVASQIGALFNEGKNAVSMLENVTLSSGKDDTLMDKGISAEKSTVTLNKVTVTQATTGIFANNDSTITVSGGSFDGKADGVYAGSNSTVILKDSATITSSEGRGLHAEGLGSQITMAGGTVTTKNESPALTAEKEGRIDATNVSLTTGGKGTGAVALGKNSIIQLHGATTINNTLNGLEAVDSGKITSENLTVIGGEVTNEKSNKERSGIWAAGSGSEIKLTGKTIIKHVDEGFYADGGSKIISGDLTITGSDSEEITTVGIGSYEPNSAIELNGKTIIQNFDTGLAAVNNSTIKMKNGDVGATQNAVENKIAAKKIALTVAVGGHIEVTDVTLTTNDFGIGANANDSGSIIELKGQTTIENVKNGLIAKKGSKITSENLTIIGGEVTNEKPSDKNFDKDRSGLWTAGSGSEIKLTGKTIIKNVDEGFYADGGSKIISGDLTIIGGESKEITTVGIGSYEPNSAIELNGKTIIQNFDTGLAAVNNSTIKMKNGDVGATQSAVENKIAAKKIALTVAAGGHIEVTDVTLTTNDFGIGAGANDSGSIIELKGKTTIENVKNGLIAKKGSKITSENLTVIGGEVTNEKPNKKRSGIWTTGSGSEIKLTGKTTIHNFDKGFLVEDGSKLISGDLTITGGDSKEITTGISSSEPNSVVELNGKTTIQNVDIGLVATDDATIKTSNSTIDAHSEGLDNKFSASKKNKIAVKKVAIFVINGGYVDLQNVSITAEKSGLQFLAISDIDKSDPYDPLKCQSNEINLTNANLHVENGTGIFAGGFTNDSIQDFSGLSVGRVNLKNSEIHADVLLADGMFEDPQFTLKSTYWDDKNVKAISNGTFTLNADHSTLEGRASIAENRNVHFDLNNTTWTLKNSTKEKDKDGNLLDIAQRSRSDVSVLNLNDSSVIFNDPTEEHYHTLHIGSGKPDTQEVYKATGEAKIYFNAEWSDGAAIADQKTDRLLINGDVSGTTAVYVTRRLGENNVEENTSAAANGRGLSLIQVSGKAQEDSFKLAHGYTTRSGSPDMYTLRAYGPDSSHGKADIAQNLLDEKNEDFWDFRLQPELLKTDPSGNSSSSGGSGGAIAAPVPQTANYLVMPNALFYTGLTDMAKQNALLANIRTSIPRKEEEKNTGFFLYTYGSTGTLSSERGPLKYGYGADIRYAALQAGVTLAPIERQNVNTRFGLLGTYGQLSFTPKDIADVSKSTVDKWSLTAYASLQHDNGFYLDTLLSYGVIKGEIGNAIRGKTAKLNDAKMFSLSSTIGKQFATGMEGLTFEPQAQLAYQHLMFKPIEDADNLTIDINNPSQWLIRVGGRLTKAIATENNRPVSLYGKVNFIKTFGDDGSIHIGRDFDLDPMGPALEGGVGINAQLSHNFSLHGDMSYQQKLQKTGISGASFSGGVRYHF